MKFGKVCYSTLCDLLVLRLTCLYLACKIDEYYIPFKEYITAVDADLTVEQLLSFEMEVMQKLEFHITCYHPYLSFSALVSFLEEESWWNTKANQVDKKKLYRYARSLIHTSLLTDLMFYLTPGQIALGILSYAFSHFHLSFPLDCFLKLKDENKETRVTNDEEWLSLWEQAIAVLKREMSTCGGLYTWNISSGDETQQLLKKLSLCMDPRVDPTSAEYFAMIKKKEDMKEMRRLEKNRAFAERRKREFAMITGIGEELSQENNLKEDSELQPEDLSKKLEKPQESELDETNKKRRTRE